MTNYYTKELNTDNQKKSKEFAKEVNQIKSETDQLKAQKEKADQRIPEIKKELSRLVTDVDIITNDSKRKKVLKDKNTLQEELNELELYSIMDIQTYQNTRLNAVYDLGMQAQEEYSAYAEKAINLLSAARKEVQDKEDEVMLAKNKLHPFLQYQSMIHKLRQDKRVAEIKKEQEEEKKKALTV